MPEHTPPPPCPPLADQLTVTASVVVDQTRRESMQAVVSKWATPSTWGECRAVDAGRTDGLNATGYFGAVFDGRYVYFSPEHHDDLSTHAVVLRYDTHAPFDADGFEAFDASTAVGDGYRGYYGAVFDGRHVYFCPRQIDMDAPHSRVLRFDTRGAFKAPDSWTGFDIGEGHTSQSGAFDGRYVYFSPGYESKADSDSHSGRVMRYDTQWHFDQQSSYAVFDTKQAGGPMAANYDGAVFDGRHVYFVPLANSVITRVDTTADFASPEAWQSFDARPLGLGMCVGGVFDGRHVYFAAYNNPRMVRFDTTRDFADPGAFDTYDADHTSGLRTAGFDGAFFDGRYVYFIPFIRENDDADRADSDPPYHLHGNMLRYDPLLAFDDAAAWSAIDTGHTDGLLSWGYNGGAFDGRFCYLAPWRSKRTSPPGTHGVVLRYDTIGQHGAFGLRAGDLGHNGGLCGASPGPTLIVNTSDRAYSVSIADALAPGRHHLAGVYDGAQLFLYVDGKCVARGPASGTLSGGDAPVTVGSLQGGLAAFAGTVEACTIDAAAWTADRIAAAAGAWL